MRPTRWIVTIVLAAGAGRASAFPFIFDAWQQVYPTSTIPQRIGPITGLECATCHHPPILGDVGTCYREDLKIALRSISSPAQAIRAIDQLDSDGDGVPNGVEIRAARSDLPGEVGYHAGLRGPLGVDVCSPTEPGAAITGQPETPPTYCAANCDGSTTIPVLNALDFACFLRLFIQAATLDARLQVKAYANCDGSTAVPVLSALDFACFLNRLQAGCP